MAIVRSSKEGEATQQQDESTGVIRPKSIALPDLFARSASRGAWGGDALAYLNEIRDILEDPSQPSKAEMKYLSDEAVSFSIGNNSIVLVRDSDQSNIQALINDSKIYAAQSLFQDIMKGKTLLNVITVNRFMFNRSAKMAAYLKNTLVASEDDQINDLVLDNFDRYQIHIDTEMSNVRAFFDEYSTSPVVSGDFGFIAGISTKTNDLYGAPDIKPMFGVTGYVEFLLNEANNTYTPVVHVTDILSVLSTTKILAIALPLIADIFITRGLWRQPFSTFGKVGVNLGKLIIDPATQQPYEIKNDTQLRTMFSEYINPPILTIDIKSGAASIPGLTTLTRAQDHQYLVNQIYSFLNVGLENAPNMGVIAQNRFKEIIGVLEKGKGRIGSNLTDTRDLNYLNLLSTLKWSPELEPLKVRYDADPLSRWNYLKKLIGDECIVPTHISITTVIYGEFVSAISQVVASKLSVLMPSLTTIPTIDLNDIAAKSFIPGNSVFGTTGASQTGGFPRF